MSKLILSNKTEITIEDGSSLSDVRVLSEASEFLSAKANMLSTWDMFTNENIQSIQFKNDDGIVIGNYENLVFESETSKILENGNILTSYYLRKKTDIELLKERLEQLETGQEIQDGAIGDLGALISDLTEGA